MKAFELILPLADNRGKPTDNLHRVFQTAALDMAGGYTKRPSGEGAWKDTDGRVYYDRMVPYHFACDRETFDRIKALAFSLFADQKALYWREYDGVEIERRPAARQPDKATSRSKGGASW